MRCVSGCLGVSARVTSPGACVSELDRKLPEGRNTCFIRGATQRLHIVSIQ